MKKLKPAEAAALIRERRRLAAFTGAGISVDSGIPDFRSKGGLWSRFDPMEYATITAFRRNPAKVWVMLKEMDGLLLAARPNPAHYALAELEARGVLKGIITQNVDNLHQAAGSRSVIEYHGNAHRFTCLSCKGHWLREHLDFGQVPLYCSCGGLIKPDVVFFGEAIPPQAHEAAVALALACELFIIIGTSGEVAPANQLPFLAKDAGALILENNLEPTLLTRTVTDYLVEGSAAQVWARIMEAL
uniref:protein acetyllysine N-acetyltransferase n=1 Tax=Desulfobacca acetoxidans TaxID=60893 RepID=A0A7V4LDP8_9BACT